MTISKKIAICLFPISLLAMNANAAYPTQCFTNATITSVGVGYVADSYSECPDDGNCISFTYTVGNKSYNSYVNVNVNLNDGQKGMAMYDTLKTAMILGYKVTGFSNNNNCAGSYPQIDGIKLMAN